MTWVKSVLQSDDNFARFKSLYRPPVPTNELCESIFSQFERVFEAQDAYDKFEFDNSETEIDAAEYRKKIGDHSFWETQGFETFKDAIDNVLVIDLPKLLVDDSGQVVQESEYPEPYYFILDIMSVLDIENTKVKAVDRLTGKSFYYFKTEYLIFIDDQKRVCVFDDTYYRTFDYEAGKEPVLVDEIAHNLGFTPARSFWTTPLNGKTNILKRNVITNSLSELDWLLFFNISAKYLKLYAPFPIYAVYKGICNYKDPEAKVKCVDGWLVRDGSKQGEHSGTRCPKCKNKIKTGAGNVLELRAPQDKDDPDLLANPIKVISADKISLDAVNEEIKSLNENIFSSCVGKGVDPKNDQAQNELQIQAGFESRTNVLMKVKRNFEIIHEFALDTIYRLRYGDKYKGGTISYGTQFFLKDETAELEDYKTAKEQKFPAYDLSLRKKRVDEARYRNNPDMLERIKILSNLDPFPDQSLDEVLLLKKDNPDLIDELDLIVKINFNRFISRFEREQASVNTFGSAINFDKKIDVMSEILRKYAEEYKANLEDEEEDEPEPPAPPQPPGFPPNPAPGDPPNPTDPPNPQPEPVPAE